MARHQMAAEPVGQRQRLFQIDFAQGIEACRAVQAFTRYVDTEAVGALGNHRHAGAVELRNRIAQRHIGQRQAAGIERQAQAGIGLLSQVVKWQRFYRRRRLFL